MNFKKMILLGMSALVLSACNTQTTGGSDSEAAGNDAETTEQVSNETTASGAVSAVDFSNADMEDEEAWKKEPAYGSLISLASTSGCTAPINVADTMGFYEEEGIEVELVQSQTSTMDAVATGQSAIGADHITSSLVPMVNNLNIQFIGPMHSGCKALYVAGDSEIESAGDMDDMSIGIHNGIGQSDHNIALRFLLEEGADADSISFVNTDVAASPQAITNGELDGAIFTENYALPFVEDGTLKKVNSITTDEEFADEVCCAYFVNKDYARENPITTKKLVRAMFKANSMKNEDVESYVDHLYENDLLSGDKELSLNWIDSLDYDLTNDQMEATVREITEDYIELGMFDSDTNADDVLEQVWTPSGLEIGKEN